MWRNLNKRWKDKELKAAFWQCAKATTDQEFNDAMAAVKRINKQAWEYLSKFEQEQWSRSRFSEWPKVDNLTSNNCESFNSTIVGLRGKSILTILEELRFYIMKTMATHKDSLMTYTGQITPVQQSRERMRSLKTMSITSSPSRHIIGLTSFTLAAYRVKSTGNITKGCHVGHNSRTCLEKGTGRGAEEPDLDEEEAREQEANWEETMEAVHAAHVANEEDLTQNHPQSALKAEPTIAEPPSKEEIQDIITTIAASTADSENEEEAGDERMNDAGGAVDEVARALNVADALGKADKLDDIALGLKELDMEHYDDEDEGVEVFSSRIGDLYYPSNDLDPYIKDKNDDDDSEELEDMIINPTDSVVVCARTEDDFSLLEVHILEDVGTSEMNMYVHHDIIIPTFSLSTAWLDCLQGREKGNFLAVGSMEPSIEIWDLDVIDVVQPCMVLGGILEKKKKGKKKSIKYKDDSHTDSVLGLAWNKALRNVLASASADKRVKIWDVATGKCESTMEHQSDKASSMLKCN
ncbi:uncharacterized protein [Arachis hypogaea]|uniref:uncharacterized protein n=1 Tax=Arachis hypogaea TaxID=3818 RepID=UPI003B224C21